MPATYTLIAANTLTSEQSSVTFSSIPGTYTDLLLKWSVRGWNGATNTEGIYLRFNSDSATNYSVTPIYANAGAVSSSRNSNGNILFFDYGVNGTGSTANTFSSAEMYIPSYTDSQNKPLSAFSAVENNSASIYGISFVAGLWRNTAAITSIVLTPTTSTNFNRNSSFFLYGIKNS